MALKEQHTQQTLPEAANALAFDVGGTRIKAGIVRGAEVLKLHIEPLPAQRDAVSVIGALVQLGRQLQMEHTVQAIGVSMKGIIDPRRGVILDVNESLSDLIGLPFKVVKAFVK